MTHHVSPVDLPVAGLTERDGRLSTEHLWNDVVLMGRRIPAVETSPQGGAHLRNTAPAGTSTMLSTTSTGTRRVIPLYSTT